MNNIQKELLDVLKSFDKLCSDYNLRYHLAYGTLLGAARHKGFIPWDDDVDVVMPVDDYFKLLKLKTDDNHFIQSIETDKTYYYLFAKFKNKVSSSATTKEDVLYKRQYNGAWVDIFPCIGIPDISTRKFKKWRTQRMFLCSLLALKAIPFGKSSLKKKIFKPIAFFIPRKIIVNKLNKSYKKFKNIDCQLLYVQDNWSTDSKLVLDNYTFDKKTLLDFEGCLLPVPINYHKVLTDYYGDYMTPPPLEKRHGHLN